MEFSIIVPTLNEANSIVSCLSAIQALRDRCEIIVVDGGSNDRTTELAKLLADKLILSEQGRAVQMNAGAKIAAGDVLVFLHADTFMPENALSLISQAVSNKHQWGRFDVILSGRHPMLKVVAFFMNWRSRLTGIATGDQVIFVKKSIFDEVGQYPTIALMEDIALSKMLNKIGPPACLFAKVKTSGRRWEHNGIFKTILLMWNLRMRYFLGEEPQVLAYLYREGKFWKP